MKFFASLFFVTSILMTIFNFNTAVAGDKTIETASMNPQFYIGKKILAGISQYDKDGKLLSSKQIAGKIVCVSKHEITIQLENSEIKYNLPRDFSALHKAQPGIYNLKNGNVKSFEDPDFTVIYHIYPREYK